MVSEAGGILLLFLLLVTVLKVEREGGRCAFPPEASIAFFIVIGWSLGSITFSDTFANSISS